MYQSAMNSMTYSLLNEGAGISGHVGREERKGPFSSWSVCCGPWLAEFPSFYPQELAEGIVPETNSGCAVKTKSLATVSEYDQA